MRSFFTAWHFLCLVSIPFCNDTRIRTPQEMSRAMACFPLVGIVFGLILLGSWQVLSLYLDKTVASLLVLLILVLLSGAMHVDGLADTIDGIYGGRGDREATLRIMSDHNIGAMALTGVLFNFLLKGAAINAVPAERMAAGLVLLPAVGKWLITAAALFYPPAKKEGLGKLFSSTMTAPVFMISTIIISIAAFYLLNFKGILILLLAFIIMSAVLPFIKKRIGGVTGDIFGAINEISETVFLIMLIV